MIEQAFQQAIQHHQKGDIQNAQRLYLEVLRAQPEHALALRNLGLIALETGHIEDAVDLYQKALRLRPEVAMWKSELAQVYSRSGDGIAAKNQLLGALRIEPRNSLFLYLLGNLLTDLGQVGDAIQAYRQAIQINPAQARVYSAMAHLAATGDYKFTPEEQRQLQHQVNNPHLSPDDLSHIHFALANLSQRKKQLDKAFHHFCEANRLKKQATPAWQQFKPEQLNAELQQIKTIFNEGFIDAHAQFGIDSEIPVFIVGMPRTGTTLIERILSGHPEVVGRGELMHIKTLARDGLRFKTKQTYPLNLSTANQADIRTLARQYVQRVLGQDRHAQRVIDKMPTNYQMLGLIYLLFPNAHVIHTVRDPMDTLWSCFTRNLSARFTNDFADLKAMYDNYREYMDFWHERLPMKILDFHYEELVSDFENQARRLIEFLDLEWHPDCLQYNKQQTQVATASKMQVRKPIYRSAVQAWKKYESHLQPLRQQMSVYYSENTAAEQSAG